MHFVDLSILEFEETREKKDGSCVCKRKNRPSVYLDVGDGVDSGVVTLS